MPARRCLASLSLCLALALLTGCGATVQTALRPTLPLERSVRKARLSPDEAQAFARLSPEEKAHTLKSWAGDNPARLTRASTLLLRQACRRPVQRTEAAPGFALTAARFAWESLQRSGVPAQQWPTAAATQPALSAYNESVALFVLLTSSSLVEAAPKSITTPYGEVSLAFSFPQAFPAGYYDLLILSKQIQVRGFRERIKTHGLGVALVGIRERTKDRAAEMELFPRSGVAGALSCVIEFPKGEKTARVCLIDSKHDDTRKIGGSPVTLAADYTAPLAFSFGGANDLMLGIRNFFNVSLGNQDSGIYLSEPFDPDRIPVLLIHGLSSSPIVWRNVANEAMRDPVVRRNFQFIYAYYSTGAPVVFSAAEIKRNMQLIRREYGGSPQSRGSRSLTLVGYSMGGVIARILVTDIGDRLWNEISKKPFDQVKFDPEDIPAIREGLFWKPLPDVQQVIFVATPHRGTRMADASFARLASRLIQLPSDFLSFQTRFFDALASDLIGNPAVPSKVTGLDGLSANSPLFTAWDGVPFEKGVKFFSIIGDRGRGDSPNSTDGIVGYWSSHIEGAESELIVPTGHDAQASPKSEQEILRILRLNPEL